MSTGLTSESLESAAQEGVPRSSDSIGKSGHCLLSCDQSRGEGNRVEESRGTCYVHDEDDEEEDVDFNPFAKSDSAEASSSLSSEVEDLDINENDNNREKCEEAHDEIFEEKHVLGARECSSSIGGSISGIQNEEAFPATTEDGQLLISNKEIFSLSDDCNGTVHQMDSTCATDDGKASADVDGDGAICMRTRARYSLAQFTLDELETFLQETDDEEDLHRVDDEEEYKKFLAAVLRGDELQNAPENSNGDDEDEENDADFELELEEALESEPEDVEQRHMTRLNKRQKTSREHGKKVSHHAGRQLLPLIPLSLSSYPFTEGSQLAPNIAQPFVPPGNNSVCGFTPLQIGQLHCLIHEHVQLLIQVFSVCVFEPVKSHIAAEVKELISEMLRIREQAMTWKKVPFPSFCFFPPYVQPSVTDEDPRMLQPNCSYRNLIQDVPSGSNKDVSSNFSSMSSEKCVGLPGEQASFPRNPEYTSWTPYVCGPVLSVLDVAPLRLVENYADDVTSVVRAHKRCQIERGFENQCQSEPLFPYPSNSGYAESDSQGEIENNTIESNELRSSSSGSDMPKKTMAAALLKKAKSQPVSLVPKDIAKLAQRFGPLFNPALYPHKPPPAPLANRVLFTDAEDELLALGLMEFNTDWKAIQQRFLPCKSTHQIFVRQKNRASSKAPENPIKVVRRMKNSPLTSEEIARIEVGLKKFKLDWMSIWRFIVPYRDPSILPRQWRIASGTQKSYKSDANKKAKRLLYEMRRKASKTSPLSSHSPLKEKGYATDNGTGEASCWSKHMDKEDEAYVHEAFLVDWRPDTNLPSILQSAMHSEESCQTLSLIDNSGFGTNQIHPNPSTSSAHVYLRPYRARRQNTARVVKLAPDLPPVNLPPSVRIISQSAFKRNQTSACARVLGNSSRLDASEKTPCFTNHFVAAASQHGNGDTIFEKHILETNDADLQMHPLLFQSSQGAGQLPYHSVNCGSTFITGKQPQLALSLFHNPRQVKNAVSLLGKCAPSSSGVFHPLLQRNDATDTEAMVSHQATRNSNARRFGLVENSPASTSKQARERYSSSTASGMKAISPNRRNNQLDLDIHLSVTSKNQQSAQGRNTITRRTSHRSSGEFEAEAAEDSIRKDRIRSEVDAGYFEQDRAVSHRIDDASFPDIVMEQEELSDSEEEFEENIEFECEEMVDSEQDGTSDSEQLANTPNEEMLVEEIGDVNAKKQVHNA